MSTLMDVSERLSLVAPQFRDALGRVHLAHGRVDPVGPRLNHRDAGGYVLDMRHAVAMAQHDVGGVHDVKCFRPTSPYRPSAMTFHP